MDTEIARGCGGGRLVATGGKGLRDVDVEASEIGREGTMPPNRGAFARFGAGVLRGL